MTLKDYLKIINRHKFIILITTIALMAGYSIVLLRQKPDYYTSAKILLRKANYWVNTPLYYIPSLDTRLSFINTPKILEIAVEELNKKGHNYKVSQLQGLFSPSVSGEILTINIKHKNKKEAIIFVNAVARAFVKFNDDTNKKGVEGLISFLTDHIKIQKRKYIQSLNALKDFKFKHKVSDVSTELSGKVAALAALDEQYIKMDFEKNIMEKKYAYILKELNKQPQFQIITQKYTNPYLDNLRNKLLQLQLDKRLLLRKYTQEHPSIKDKEKEIQNIKEIIAQEIDKVYEKVVTVTNPAYADLLKTKISIEQNLSSYDEEMKTIKFLKQLREDQFGKLSALELDYVKLLREESVNRKVYENLLSQLDTAKMSQAMLLSSAQVLEEASGVSEKFQYKTTGLLFVSIIGLMFGIGIAYMIEYLNDTIRSVHDVERYISLPLLGSIPYIEGGSTNVLIQTALKTPLTELYHSLAVVLEFSLIEKGSKTLLLTSAEKGEGKTSAVANLGVSLAREGERVLIVDADMRKPNLHNIFSLQNSTGLSIILSGEIEAEKKLKEIETGVKEVTFLSYDDIEPIIEKTPVEGLFVVPSGPVPANPIELLKSKRMKDFIFIVKDYFDIIIFDSPPVNVVIDPVLLASILEGVVLLARAGRVTRGSAQYAKRLLTGVTNNLLGVVLNSVTSDVFEYYHYYHYYYRPEKEFIEA